MVDRQQGIIDWVASIIPTGVRPFGKAVAAPIPTKRVPPGKLIDYSKLQNEFPSNLNISVDCRDKKVLGGMLGQGGFGKVCTGRDKRTGEERAVKFVGKYDKTSQSELLGIDFNHPNIAKYYEAIELPDHLAIVMDLYHGGDIFDYLNRFNQLSECMVYIIFYQLLIAVQYLHRYGYAHLDIKPENMLLDDPLTMNIVLTDFGLTERFNKGERKATIGGTLTFLEPKAFGDLRGGIDPFAADMWACGITLYTLAVRQFPFKDMSNGRPDHSNFLMPAAWGKLSPKLKNLIVGLLQQDPMRRLNVNDALRNSWITEHTNYFEKNGTCGPGASNKGEFLQFSPGPTMKPGNQALPWKKSSEFYKHDFQGLVSDVENTGNGIEFEREAERVRQEESRGQDEAMRRRGQDDARRENELRRREQEELRRKQDEERRRGREQEELRRKQDEERRRRREQQELRRKQEETMRKEEERRRKEEERRRKQEEIRRKEEERREETRRMQEEERMRVQERMRRRGEEEERMRVQERMRRREEETRRIQELERESRSEDSDVTMEYYNGEGPDEEEERRRGEERWREQERRRESRSEASDVIMEDYN
jgi:hypothetical protein